tara:strand:- start:126 stop:350 length:225 start_codon:yes stop_codon:yes gene_type:complete
MHLEEQYKDSNKSEKRMTQKQSMPNNTAVVVVKNALVKTLKITVSQCAASFESQKATPIMWAGLLERENSGFSV